MICAKTSTNKPKKIFIMAQRVQMTIIEYKKLQERAKIVAVALMRHENKNLAKVTFPFVNYRKVSIQDQDFYYAGTNIFLVIIEEVLIEAMQKFPLNFGNGNAISVLRALNLTRYLSSRLRDAIRIYGNENFIWVYDNLEEGEDNRVLRIDLFRKLDKIPHHKRKKEFTGGIFHALKHFSFYGKPLSTGKEINNLRHSEQIIHLIIQAFYLDSGSFDDKGENYVVYVGLNERYNLKFIFYYEKNTKVYFIKTIFKTKKKNH